MHSIALFWGGAGIDEGRGSAYSGKKKLIEKASLWACSSLLLKTKEDSGLTGTSAPGRITHGGLSPSWSNGGLDAGTKTKLSSRFDRVHVVLKATRDTHSPSPPGTGSGECIAVCLLNGRPKVMAESSTNTKTGVVVPVSTAVSNITGYMNFPLETACWRNRMSWTSAADGAAVTCVWSRRRFADSSC